MIVECKKLTLSGIKLVTPFLLCYSFNQQAAGPVQRSLVTGVLWVVQDGVLRRPRPGDLRWRPLLTEQVVLQTAAAAAT